jgi:hypothetical protein
MNYFCIDSLKAELEKATDPKEKEMLLRALEEMEGQYHDYLEDSGYYDY